MSHKPSKDASKPSSRRKIIRNEMERQTLLQIAQLFDESEKAYALLKRQINNGYISTPDKDMPIQDFLKAHQEEWLRRNELEIPHSIQFLRDSLSSRILSSTSLEHSYGGSNLDQIEGKSDPIGQYRGKYGKFSRD